MGNCFACILSGISKIKIFILSKLNKIDNPIRSERKLKAINRHSHENGQEMCELRECDKMAVDGLADMSEVSYDGSSHNDIETPESDLSKNIYDEECRAEFESDFEYSDG